RLQPDRAGDEVADVGAALREVVERDRGGEHVVVDDERAVADLDEQVAGVAVVEVAGDPGALGLPVQPGAERAVVDAVAADDDVDRGVQLDAADLVAEELPDRKSTRLNSSHVKISYAVFCLKKKTIVSGVLTPQ